MTATGEQHDGDRGDVQEAARRLGVTPDAIRARLRRGSLEGGKDGDAWYVILPAEDPDDTRQDTDTTATAGGETIDPLVEQLRGEVAYLRSELTAAREQAAKERERADVIQREALDRIQGMIPIALGPTADQQDSDRTSTGHDAMADAVEHDNAGVWRRLGRWLRGE